ncbi:hypothetical protein evm_014045 [Chilo suppressalis]|nr:hypothetical protein evm_014045 [Chilo suppressalis]
MRSCCGFGCVAGRNKNERGRPDEWRVIPILDSGCSDHIVNDDRYYTEFINLENPIDVKVGDGFSLKANKIGSINILCNVTGFLNKEIHKNVKSYTSVSQMTNKEKWHRILGHTNFKNLQQMCAYESLQGLPNKIENSYIQCEICLTSKMCNLPFANNRHQTRDILQLIHTDVHGPLNPTGYGGERYFVSFIDDFSKIAMVYCINKKSEVFDCFFKYIRFVQNKTEKNIKEIRCDNGKEYINKDFFKLCKQEGIYLNPAPPYTHELNGVAERYNRTIMDRARCLLQEAKLDKRYWPECVKAASYIGNRLLTNTYIKKTPYELFFGIKPDVSHFKIYGSSAFVRIPEECRTSKLNAKAIKGVLVGYTDMGYRVLVENKIIISRHVRFIDNDAQSIKLDTHRVKMKIVKKILQK